jgi:hypothetical protein
MAACVMHMHKHTCHRLARQDVANVVSSVACSLQRDLLVIECALHLHVRSPMTS